jgi:two-component system response regulator
MVSTAMKSQPAVILLVEDDLGDQVLTQEAFKSFKTPYDLRIVPDGKEALDYLYRKGDYETEAAPEPDLILLDLNMPRVNGQQVAERVHADPRLRQIPIVVLTTSRREEDVVRLYGRGATTFITKPLDFKQFMATVRDLEYLIKFVAELKNLRDCARVTDAQIRKLTRRRQQLQRLTDGLFDQHMRQIEAIFLENRGRLGPAAEPQQSVSCTETAAGRALLLLAGKILKGRPEEWKRISEERQRFPASAGHYRRPEEWKRISEEPAMESGAFHGAGAPNEPTEMSEGLARLARSLNNLSEKSASPSAGQDETNHSTPEAPEHAENP